MHSRDTDRDLHGFDRGGLRSILQLWTTSPLVAFRHSVIRSMAIMPKFSDEIITLSRGGGGKASHQLVESVFRSALSNSVLDRLDDCAVLPHLDARIAFTTDSYVVDPLFFPGGDIGRVAVNGTINDLATAGAETDWIVAGSHP